jgi:hypothetical protein
MIDSYQKLLKDEPPRDSCTLSEASVLEGQLHESRGIQTTTCRNP